MAFLMVYREGKSLLLINYYKKYSLALLKAVILVDTVSIKSIGLGIGFRCQTAECGECILRTVQKLHHEDKSTPQKG